ncbi:MAG: hypothetical protein C5B45_03885 [Chlamydiae bacterium]|nr:MAG: hypothetical protein C5B45_03885 [Chlamydiota bacterium]
MNLFLLLLICFTPLTSQEIDNKPSINHRLQLIPPEERKALEGFFRRLFYHADFSYTLFGLKPMGSIDYSLSHLRFPVFYKNPEQHLYLMALDEKDWNVWERCQHLFPMEKYSFVKVEKDHSFGFFLVNKEKSYAVIEKNLQLFQNLTGKKICPRTLLHMLCQGQLAYSFSSAPYSTLYHKALGLLYGYGEENVQVFIKRNQLLQTLSNLPLDVKNLPSEIARYLGRTETSKRPAKSPPKIEVASLVSELKKLLDENHFVKGTKKDNPFLPIKRSCFFGSEEYAQTQSLMESRDEITSLIVKIYESEIFLETILGMLTAP